LKLYGIAHIRAMLSNFRGDSAAASLKLDANLQADVVIFISAAIPPRPH